MILFLRTSKLGHDGFWPQGGKDHSRSGFWHKWIGPCNFCGKFGHLMKDYLDLACEMTKRGTKMLWWTQPSKFKGKHHGTRVKLMFNKSQAHLLGWLFNLRYSNNIFKIFHLKLEKIQIWPKNVLQYIIM